ncbi:MAG: radical SAM protein [Methanomicrobiales archaeon]|nr:radical SAM protein [Methanomicrobiales archaeon]
MTTPLVTRKPLGSFDLWETMEKGRGCVSFTLELTARCNNNCRHCYINLPAGDTCAREKELSAEQIFAIADEAVRLGAIWCTITGGEPLLRPDFAGIYVGLKRKGLLVSVLTNAALINESHVELFRRYPPRDIEVTVYGVTRETYERVTRCPGSFDACMRGLDLLHNAGIKVRLKAMAIRSNFHEAEQIAAFSRARTKDYYRFDPLLHLRMDRDPARNAEIRQERLSPEEIVALEKADPERSESLKKNCHEYISDGPGDPGSDILITCGAGTSSFVISPDGKFRLCESLNHPDCVYDLANGSIEDAWHRFIPKVRAMTSCRKEYRETCHVCPIINLCMWCPAHADLETGMPDGQTEYFCRVAHARAAALGYKK